MSDYSWKEMMAVVFSREIKDTDKITSGAHTEIFFAATMLAQKTHAPNLKLQLGGSVTLCQVTDVEVSELPKTSTGYELIRYAESVHDHPDTFLFYGAPGGKDYYKEGSEYRDVNHFWFADKFFVGGIQADKWGNTNMIGLGTKEKMTFRGPEPSASTISRSACAIPTPSSPPTISAAWSRRSISFRIPEKKICRENEFYGGGPKWIVTPKCIFDFDPDTLEARLYMTFPGVTRGRRKGEHRLRGEDRQESRDRRAADQGGTRSASRRGR